MVVLNDKHTITEALVKNADVFSDRHVPANIQVHIPETDKTGKVGLPASPFHVFFLFFIFVGCLYRRVHLLYKNMRIPNKLLHLISFTASMSSFTISQTKKRILFHST